MKFIGHLDLMRYFQKAMRRADVDIAYSSGYSPHQIMSFASPLGLGATSVGEYMDIEVNSTKSSKEMVATLNQVMVEGIEVFSYLALPEGSKNAMSLVAGADYLVMFKNGCSLTQEELQKKIIEFYNQESIVILKKTKKSEKEVDIKPMIYSLSIKEDAEFGYAIYMKLSAGSANNLKPELVMEALCQFLGTSFDEFSIQVHRLDLFAHDTNLISLEELGEEIE